MSEEITLYQSSLEDFKQGRLESAESKLRQALNLQPAYEDALEALSVILYQQRRYGEAITVIQSWIRMHPHSIMAQTNLSRCYVAQGMILEAEKAQAEARRLTWQAELKAKKKSDPPVDYEHKIERYKKIIQIDPSDVLGYFSLATTYLEAGRKRDAADMFEKAVGVNPNHSSSYLGFSQALLALGDTIKASKILKVGIRVAEQQGDVMTQKKMEAHLKSLPQN